MKYMKLKLNGTETELRDELTVTGLLETLKIDPGRVAVEVNLKIVKKCDYEKHTLNDGDAVEIVNFVGGG
jgi:thiamine biosynthesis protein ThiS